MIALADLKTWLEAELAQAIEGEQIEGNSKWKAYTAVLASISRQTSAWDVASCVRAWARILPKIQENEEACRAAERIAAYIESSYTWDIYTYGFGVELTHRVEGPFSIYQEAIERVLILWNETGKYHTTILIGGMEDLRLQKQPCISYYQEYQDANKTMKADGCIAFVLEDGRAYYQGDRIQPVTALECLLTQCKEISEEDVRREYPELVEFARGKSTVAR